MHCAALIKGWQFHQLATRIMYDPKGNGKDKTVSEVSFIEACPPDDLKHVVHRFLDVRTTAPLDEDYKFHALPDACTYVVFDCLRPKVAGVTKIQAGSAEMNLGKEFHFINIRFLPGVWQGDPSDIQFGNVDQNYQGDLPLRQISETLDRESLTASAVILSEFVRQLVADGIVVRNPLTEKILTHIFDLQSVADMADICDLSPRQLQRVLKRTTGFTPHDFLKVLRLQQSLAGEMSDSYADQSHFIHSFRNATGYTPGRYAKKFDV